MSNEAQQNGVERIGRSIFIEHAGKKQTVKEWANEIGLDYQKLLSRINSGWPVSLAVSIGPGIRFKKPGAVPKEKPKKASNRYVRHGMTDTPTYRTWHAMITRCTNPKNDNFSYYGGRGIQVCERWRVFANFLADMGLRPAGMTLDRKDTDGHYAPGNCRWATHQEQINNQRSPKTIVPGVALAAARLGISRQALHQRMQKCRAAGVPVENAFDDITYSKVPKKQRGRQKESTPVL